MTAIDFPSNPTVGQSLTVGTRTWIWDGTVWGNQSTREFVRTVSDTAPSNPQVGDEWFNSSTGRLYNYYDGFWIEIGAAIGGADGDPGKFIVSATPPADPEEGDAWFDSDTAKLYVYYDSFWVEASPPAEGPQGPAGADGQDGVASATAPLSYNSTTRNISIDLSAYYTSTQADTAISTAISNLIDSAPSTLNTLNELAAALSDDPSFATTITNQIANKQDVVPNVSSTEIGYLDGVTSAIQTQLNGKASTSHTHAISDVTNLQTSLDAKADLTQTILARTSGYTLTAAEKGDLVTCNGTFTITVPGNVFAAGDRVDFINIGSGTITFSGSSLTLNAADAKFTVNKQWAGATIFFTSATTAVLIGNLA